MSEFFKERRVLPPDYPQQAREPLKITRRPGFRRVAFR